MALTDWAEYPTGDYTTQEETPYALTIIVRLEKNVEPPTDLLVKRAAASAMVEFFKDNRTAPEGKWYQQIENWVECRIRKIARRARGAEWERVIQNVDGLYHADGDVEIFIVPPHPVDATPEDVRKLQVSGLDLQKGQEVDMDLTNNVLFISLNPAIEMTTGKSLAQVGHAVQLAIFKNSAETLKKWQAENCPLFFVGWEDFHDIAAGVKFEPVIEVRDAGFTEVEAGSLTVKAVLVG
jgi:peptidyl-tRNA hydrolase